MTADRDDDGPAPSAGEDTGPASDEDHSTDATGTDDGATVSPDFEKEFPSVTAGSDPSESPSSTVEASETTADASGGETVSPAEAAEEAGGDGLGWQGWVLVAGLVVAMVLVPWAIVFLPAIQGALGSLGLGLRDAYLVLPMIPAVGLGALAVWAAIAYRRRAN